MAEPSKRESRSGGRSVRGADPELLLRIRSLPLRARLVVEGFLTGLHRSPYHGFSAEFSEYRPYTLGDDLRYLDWRLLARTDRRYVKRFEEETNLRCYLVVDRSRSMGYGSDRSPKADYARTLAATLAHFLHGQRDCVGLITFDEAIQDMLPARHRSGHLQRLFALLDREVSGTGTEVVGALERVAGLVHSRGIVVLISDLLSPLEGLDVVFGQLRFRGHEVVVFRVLDPAELDFPFEDAATFEDIESGRHLYIDPATARAQYQESFAEHRRGVVQLCRNHGVDLVEWTTDRPLEEALLEYLGARSRRGRSVMRRAATGPSS